MMPPPLFSSLSARLPDASTFAAPFDAVFAGLLIASGITLALLTALTLTFLIRYRRGATTNRAPGRLATWKIETLWTVATLIVFLGFFFWGARIYIRMKRVPAAADANEVSVVGRQWMWDVRHADGRREFNEMHVPVNRPVRLLLSSEDVIHSFFVPAFRLKQDLVPGKVVSAWFMPTRPGSYTLFCAQYCGTAHAEMLGRIVVLPPKAYAAWLAGGEPTAAAQPDRGRRLFVKYACNSCHDPRAAVPAPSLDGIYGREIRLADGAVVHADDQYLHDSILRASKQVVAGYALVMPSYEGVIPESDVLELVSYLKSLGRPTTDRHQNRRE
jgi:cytochrome c oxidase subunit 2